MDDLHQPRRLACEVPLHHQLLGRAKTRSNIGHIRGKARVGGTQLLQAAAEVDEEMAECGSEFVARVGPGDRPACGQRLVMAEGYLSTII